MKLVRSLIRTVRDALNLSPAAAPAEVGPVFIQPPPEPVNVDALLDLALVMRERWVPDASFAEPKGESEMLVEAALARVFPELAVTAEACLCVALDCPRDKCPLDPCPTRDEAQANDDKLAAFLEPVERPIVTINVATTGLGTLALIVERLRLEAKAIELAGERSDFATIPFRS